MSEYLQSARPIDQVHPDADQLTAFAEHALPQHEQEQTLAHLAACADCREVVFLAQQAVEVEAVAAGPVRRPWFSGWNLVWPALVAVAGMVAFSVHLRSVAKPAAVADQADKRAAVVLEQPPVPAAPPLVLAAPPLVRQAAVKPVPLVNAKRVQEPPQLGAVLADSVAPKGRPKVSQRPQVAQLGEGKAVPDGAWLHGVMAGAPGGVASTPAPVTLAAPPLVSPPPAAPSLAAPPPSSPPLVNRPAARSGLAAQQAQNGNLVGGAQAPAEAAPRQAQMRAMAPVPQPPAPKPAPVAAAKALAPPLAASNETVTVTAAQSVELDTLSAEGGLIEGGPVKLPALLLPSHLEAVSSARYGAVRLALDPAGTLFWSKDQGKHWKRVKPQWEGRVATIRVPQPVAGPPFELMTAVGVIWTSSDGQHWKRK